MDINTPRWDCGNAKNQVFTWNSNTFQLQLLSNPNKCIDLYGGNATNGAQLEIWYV